MASTAKVLIITGQVTDLKREIGSQCQVPRKEVDACPYVTSSAITLRPGRGTML